MGTLLLRLAAPMQAWGDESKYDIRGTKNEPTKSGVIGLITAAMGYRRDSEDIAKLSDELRVGVRVDQPGNVISDFHTALAPKYDSKGNLRYEKDGFIIMENSPYVTHRYYLCDACFLVGIESDDMVLLKKIESAINTPTFPLYLGRRSCPPTLPLCLGCTDLSLEDALRQKEWIASEWYKKRQKSERARIVIETKKGQTTWYTQMDQPVSFSPIHRRYALRGLEKEQYVMLGQPKHDPMAVL